MSKTEEKSFNLKEKKYRWEALKRSETFPKELTNIYNKFLQSNKCTNNPKVFAFFLTLYNPEMINLLQHYDIDPNYPFTEILFNDNDNNWEPRRHNCVQLIRQESDNFPVKLAIKDNRMIIKIDTGKPIKQILCEIGELLNVYGKVPLKETKKPSYDLEDFVLYDMSKELSSWEITKKLNPEIKDKSYKYDKKNSDPLARQLHKRICDAIKRAKTAISGIQ